MNNQQLTDFVKSELTKVAGKKRLGRDYSFILCPFHQEKTPSGRVFHDGISGVGRYRCYGCGKKCSWNELAVSLGLEPIDKKLAREVGQKIPPANYSLADDEFLSVSKNQEEDLKHFDITNPTYQKYAGIVGNKWRGFKTKFLDKIGCTLVRKHFAEADYQKFYVYLPVLVKGKQRGYIKAQIKKSKDKSVPSYINSTGSWSRKYGLFPYDFAISLMKDQGLQTLVLVEGPRDALRLLRFGIPAVCILGTQSWSQQKIRLLTLSGASRIILMMDGDLAGKKATRLLKTGLDVNGNQVASPLSEHVQVKTMKLWKFSKKGQEAYDPGNCPTDLLFMVKDYLV